MAKQGSMKESNGGVHFEFSESEYEVFDILLNLGTLIEQSELGSSVKRQKEAPEMRAEGGGRKVRQPFTAVWGKKKRVVRTLRNPSNNSIFATANQKTTTTAEPSPKQQVKVSPPPPPPATSPDTPLGFCPSSESNDNSSPRQLKRRRDELLVEEKKLRERRERLMKEVESLTSYRKKLLAYNMELKAKKQMVVSATCTTYQEGEEKSSNVEVVSRTGQLCEAGTAVNPPRPQSYFMANPNPMPILESHPQYQQIPNPAVYGQVGRAMAMFASSSAIIGGKVGSLSSPSPSPKEELTTAGGLTQSQWQSSLDFESQARSVKSMEARRYRRMVLSRHRCQMKMKRKLNP